MARSLSAALLLLLVVAAVVAEVDAYIYAPVFFLEKDWQRGSKMTFHFTRGAGVAGGAPALSRARADSIPFASAKIPEILSRLSVPAGSPAAAAIRSTLAECEAPPLAGEAKLCATSFESMVDFAASSLGTRDVRAVSTTKAAGKETIRQVYTVQDLKPLAASGVGKVVCHRVPYPYAVSRCHYTPTTAAYAVTLAGADGSTSSVKAVGVCHNQVAPEPEVAEAYKKLGVAPGSVPVCHFLPQDDMLWVRN